jgi:hypothetical protein
VTVMAFWGVGAATGVLEAVGSAARKGEAARQLSMSEATSRRRRPGAGLRDELAGILITRGSSNTFEMRRQGRRQTLPMASGMPPAPGCGGTIALRGMRGVIH